MSRDKIAEGFGDRGLKDADENPETECQRHEKGIDIKLTLSIRKNNKAV